MKSTVRVEGCPRQAKWWNSGQLKPSALSEKMVVEFSKPGESGLSCVYFVQKSWHTTWPRGGTLTWLELYFLQMEEQLISFEWHVIQNSKSKNHLEVQPKHCYSIFLAIMLSLQMKFRGWRSPAGATVKSCRADGPDWQQKHPSPWRWRSKRYLIAKQKKTQLEKCILWCPLAPEKLLSNHLWLRVGGSFGLRKSVISCVIKKNFF